MTSADTITSVKPRKRLYRWCSMPACQVMDGIRMWEVDGVHEPRLRPLRLQRYAKR